MLCGARSVVCESRQPRQDEYRSGRSVETTLSEPHVLLDRDVVAYPPELSLEADPGWVVRARLDRVEWRAALRVGVLRDPSSADLTVLTCLLYD
jgi:hypothetical protein